MKKVVVFDYGSGNVHSACRALEEAGAEVQLSSDRKLALEAHGLLIPGVGAFSSVMQKLNDSRVDALLDSRLSAGRPVMGICVGMQVMFEKGYEHGIETAGFAQWPGVVDMLGAETLPHIGWSTIEVGQGSVLFDGVDQERFYFVHSYGVTKWELEVQEPFIAPVLTWSEHGEQFLAAVENGPLSATQFHPEKSGAAGIKLLKNWITSL
ncbi:MAG: imidazole glycerol phosphate synthase subunit HisH [Actinobacteria bacterium]|nr:imidazole glycerol phosphate synthase subunit HisH [Actinomycetota bacterium]